MRKILHLTNTAVVINLDTHTGTNIMKAIHIITN